METKLYRVNAECDQLIKEIDKMRREYAKEAGRIFEERTAGGNIAVALSRYKWMLENGKSQY